MRGILAFSTHSLNISLSIVAFSTSFPVEFGLHKYIDFNKQFEKSFLDPLRVISDKIVWELEERASIEGFFE